MYAAYFCNWSIYARGYAPSKLPADLLTHIIYAFAKTDPATGTVSLSDPWADIDKPMDLGGKGCLGDLQIIKRQHRQLRVLLSIGGWTYSGDLTAAFAEDGKRRTFAKSAAELVNKYSLDGLDIDWEYPANEEQAKQYVDVLSLCRLELDALALKNNMPRSTFDLTIAAPAGPQQRDVLRVREMDRYLDYWNIMTYDYAGSWSQKTDHHANLRGGMFSGDEVMKAYISKGVPAQKLILGMPLYGRSFNHTKGIGHSFQGVVKGKFEDGVHDIKELPMDSAREQVDPDRVAVYTQDKDVFISYENAETARLKAEYVRSNSLGGGMWWEASGDRPGNQSVISAFTNALGFSQSCKPNWLGNSSLS